MLLGLLTKSSKAVSALQSVKTLSAINLYSTSASLDLPRVPKNVEYIPGVQGYAPGFGPPALKPKKYKKKRNFKLASRSSKEISSNDSTSEGAILNKEKVQLNLNEKDVSSGSQLPKDSVSFVQKKINPLEASYSKKMSLLRQYYRAEMKDLEAKRKEEARITLEKEAEEKLKEKELQNNLAQEIIDRRMKDQFTYDKVLSDAEVNVETKPDSKTDTINPFTCPVRKAARISAKREKFDEVVQNETTARRRALLNLYHASTIYITPANIDEHLEIVINHPNKASAGLSISGGIYDQPKDLFTPRINKLLDSLNGTIDNNPGVEHIANYKPQNSIVNQYIANIVSHQDKKVPETTGSS